MDNKQIKAFERRHREQAKCVMPLICPLLDAWDGMPNDLKSEIESGSESFTLAMHEIIEAIEKHYYGE